MLLKVPLKNDKQNSIPTIIIIIVIIKKRIQEITSNKVLNPPPFISNTMSYSKKRASIKNRAL